VKTFVLGTAGHVDHGKTTLVRALTGVDTDRLREEKERGLTIDIGFAHLDLGDGVQLGIVDVPGHRDFLGNMLTGTTGLDTVLLVVSAAEGPMPQTTEHLQIAALLGIRDGVVALTNVDRAEPAFADLAEEAVRDELRSIMGRDDWPIVRVDAVRGAGVEVLRRELKALVDRLEPPVPDPVFRLPVDRSFSVPGTGTVVTGTAWTGAVEVGDRLRVLPAGHDVRVRSLQSHGEELRRVEARRRCAAGLVGVTVGEVGRGDSLVSLDMWRPVDRVAVSFQMLERGRRIIEHGTRLRVWLGTCEVMARIELPGRGAAAPGDDGFAVLDCESELVTRVGDRCILRFYSPVELLGGARVAELDPPRDWEVRTEEWAACLGPDPKASFGAAVRLAGGRGIDRDGLRLAIPHPVPEAPGGDTGETGADAAAPVRRIGDRWFDPARIDELEERFVWWLRRGHEAAPRTPALPLESLRTAADETDADSLIEAAIDRLRSAGRMVVDGPEVRLAGHDVELSGRETEVREALLAEIRSSGLMPPTPAELSDRLGVERALVNDLLRLLVEAGRIVQVTPELYVTADAEATLRSTALEVLDASEVARPTQFREALGVTRRYLIPLLEYLDGVGWTRRTEDGRIAGPAAETARP
jgi:selenocysteine-specific elongation factor